MKISKSTWLLAALLAAASVAIGSAWSTSRVRPVAEASLAAAHETFIAASSAADRASGGELGDALLPRCKEESEYDALLARDTRAMTITELSRASELNERCARPFPRAVRFSVLEMRRAYERGGDAAAILGNKAALDAVSSWGALLELQEKKAALLDEQTSLQGRYFDTEMEKLRGTMSPAEREAAFGALNERALASQEEMRVLLDTLKSAKEAEESTWSAWNDSREG